MHEKHEKIGALGERLREYSERELANAPIERPAQMYLALTWVRQQTSGDLPYCATLAHTDFLSIQGKNRRYYGGDQAWYAQRFHRKAGCGTVAVACITAYLGLYDGKPQLYAGKQEGGRLTVPGFLPHMDAVMETLSPTSFGIPWVPYLQRGAERFMQTRQMEVAEWFSLHGVCRCESSLRNAEAYLLCNLINNRPMACIHWGGVKALPVLNPDHVPEGKNVDMNWHWVIVTGMERSAEEWTVTISSCGSKYILPLRAFLRGRPSLTTPIIRTRA